MLNKILKKTITIISLLCLTINIVSCGSTATDRTSNVKKVIESQVQNENGNKNVERQVSNSSQLVGNSSSMQRPTSNTKKVELDLTSLSSTVADAQLRKLQNNKETFKGLIVKAKGEYNYYKDPTTGNEYYNCVFQSSCCPNGLEFILSDPSKYPSEQGETITVVGAFNYYDEGGVIYYNLVDASIV